MLHTEKNVTNGKPKTSEEIVFALGTPERRVAEIIYMRRCKLRWSQQELADFANSFNTVKLTQQRISDIERGATGVTWLEGCAIAKAMGCQLVEFDV